MDSSSSSNWHRITVNKDANSNAITLAVPSSQRDDFASAVVGAELLVTRKFIAPN